MLNLLEKCCICECAPSRSRCAVPAARMLELGGQNQSESGCACGAWTGVSVVDTAGDGRDRLMLAALGFERALAGCKVTSTEMRKAHGVIVWGHASSTPGW